MNLLRPFLLLVLTLSLSVTGFGAAWAKGQAPAVGEIVICRGLTVVSLHVDGEGRPTSSPHLCPDAALTLFGMVSDAPKPMLRGMVLLPAGFRIPRTGFQSAERAQVRARGPPLST